MSTRPPRSGLPLHWQTTISEHGGIVCVSVPQPSKEAATLTAEGIARTREWGGRSIAPDAEVLVELWDERSGRAIERAILTVDVDGRVEVRPLSPETKIPAAAKAGRATKRPKASKKKGRAARAGKRPR